MYIFVDFSYFNLKICFNNKMECEFCKKILSNATTLKTHQTSAKYCLKIQGKIDVFDNFECEYCSKKFTLLHYLNSHTNTCKNKNENIKNIKDEINTLQTENNTLKEDNEKLKDKIIQLEKKIVELSVRSQIYESDHKVIQDIAKQPKNNINNKILNINSLNLNKENIKDILYNKFEEIHLMNGQKSLANFTVDNFLKDDDGNLTYVCTDPSRQIFKYKDSLGDVKKDIKAKKLTNILLESGIKDINTKVAQKIWTNEDGSMDSEKFLNMEPKATEINNLGSDNSIFVNKLSAITTL